MCLCQIIKINNYFHQFNNSYSENDFITTKAGNEKFKIKQWEINIDKIIRNKYDIIFNKTYLQIHYEMGIIASPDYYHNYIKNNYFKEYLEKGICKENLNLEDIAIFKKYNYIVCNKSEIKIELFPKLEFYNIEMNFNFTLNYKNLFYEFENKVYFLIVFPVYPITVEYWYIGKPFIYKYKLFLDKDKKVIGLYKNYTKEDNEDNNKKIIIVQNKLNIIYIIIIILLIIILINVTIYFILKISKNRKKRANELDETYDYSTYSEEDKNKNIN